jgi:hypothetical protein
LGEGFMDAMVREEWQNLNQRCIAAALAILRESLQSSIQGKTDLARGDRAIAARRVFDEISREMPAPSALEVLGATFRLSPFERDVLMMCAGVELDTSFAQLCAEALGDPRHNYATFGLALAALSEGHWSALSPAAPLRRWRMIEVMPGETLTISPLRIEERILHYLAGLDYLDDRLRGLVEPSLAEPNLPSSQQALAETAARAWRQAHEGQPLPVLQLCGEDRSAKRAVAASACGLLGMRLRVLDACALPHGTVELDTFILLWEREAALGGGALLIDCEDAAVDSGEVGRDAAIGRVINRISGALIIASGVRRKSAQRPMINLELAKPTRDEQRAMWRSALQDSVTALNGSIDALVAQFRLSPSAIHAAADQAIASIEAGSATHESASAALDAALWDACRTQARPRLHDLAQPTEAVAGWADLVLPEPQQELLHEIATHVRHRTQVYEAWGFAAKGSRGLGITAVVRWAKRHRKDDGRRGSG